MRKSIFTQRQEGLTAAALINPYHIPATAKYSNKNKAAIKTIQAVTAKKIQDENIPPTPLWKNKKFEKVEALVFSDAWANRPRTGAAPVVEPLPVGILEVKRANRNFGKVPSYISGIKADLATEKQQKTDAVFALRHPGKRLLPNKERLAHLTEKAAERDQLIGAMNRLPFGKESISLQLRRKEYERQITAIEKEIRVYDRREVYVDTE